MTGLSPVSSDSETVVGAVRASCDSRHARIFVVAAALFVMMAVAPAHAAPTYQEDQLQHAEQAQAHDTAAIAARALHSIPSTSNPLAVNAGGTGATTAAGAATALGLARANLLANPSFDVWQENTTYTPTAASSPKIADRWRIFRLSSATNYTASRTVGLQADQYGLLIQRTVGDTSTALIRFGQQLFATTASTLSGVYCMSAMIQTGADWSGVGLTPHITAGTGTDELFNMSSGTFATGSGTVTWPAVTISAGLPTIIQLGCVSFNSVTPSEADVWFSTQAFTGTAGANDWIALDDVQMSPSGYAPFVHPSFVDAMTPSQWTYRKTFTYATAPAQNAGTGTGEFTFAAPVAGANSERVHVSFGSPMRVAPPGASPSPTITFFNPAATNGNARDETAAADCTSPTASNITEKGFDFVCTGAAGTAAGNKIGFHYTADARL